MLQAHGFLYIGDPHLSSKPIGRRTDTDFCGTVLGKLRYALELASDLDLVPVILGDLFHRPRDTDGRMLVETIQMMRASRHPVYCLVGNHDIDETVLTDRTALGILRAAGVLVAIDQTGPVDEFMLNHQRVGLGATPYGQDIPNDIRAHFPHAVLRVWLTHTDIAFEGAYPGSLAPFPIQGCDLVVNGHMHLSKPAIACEQTVWINPGNITRTAIDARDHQPRVWVWVPGEPLRPEIIPHEGNVFDLTGHQVATPRRGEAVPLSTSRFVAQLKADTATEAQRTADGSVWAEVFETALAEADFTPEVKAVLVALQAEVMQAQDD